MSLCTSILVFTLIIACILHNIALFTPYWQVNDPQDTIRDDISMHLGVWIRCTSFSTGNQACDDFNRNLLGLSIEVLLGRFIGVVSMLFSLAGIVTLCLTWNCAKLRKRSKKYCKLSSGLLTFFAGVGLIFITAFYAHKVQEEFWVATNARIAGRITNPNRYVFGWSLIVGWITGAIEIITGIILIVIASRMDSSPTSMSYSYNSYPEGAKNHAYRPEQPAPIYDKEYV